MIYSIEQIQKLYEKLEKSQKLSNVKEPEVLKVISKPEKIKPEVKIITY